MKRIENYWWRFREKIFKRCHIDHIFKTKVGVKGIIGIPHPQIKPLYSDTFVLTPGDLFLGVDFLKDEYTLLGCNIQDSPHYEFLKAIRDKKDLSKTDYIKRFEKGTLDGRRGMPKQTNFQRYIDKYNIRVVEIESGLTSPVFVYKVGERFYIYDGKHRAALYVMTGKPIVCQQVYVNLWGGKYDLIKQDKDYHKHHEFFQKML